MVSRKRGRGEMESEEPAKEPSMLDRLRNMWEFANLMQYIFLFGKAVKIDENITIETLETECLRPQPSQELARIGLALLKFVSSNKGLTPENFDEFTYRQYKQKAPHRNPFGTPEELETKFDDFDVFTKIRVLQQLSVWTLHNADRIRERIGATDAEQTNWRMEPFGWDSEDRTYFVFDDDRLYRRTDPPPPPPPSKSKLKSKARKSKGTRGSKRRKLSTPEPEEVEEQEDGTIVEVQEPEDDGLGGMKWECLCVNMADYQEFMEGIRRSRDPNEKAMYQSLQEDVLPIIERKVEEQQREEAKRQKELEILSKLAVAKRSSRISAKTDARRKEEEAAEAERKQRADLAMAKKEQEKQRKMEEARESRMMTREQRLKEREVKRILHEEELKKLEENSHRLETNEARLSERHLRNEMERAKKELEKLEEDDWVFDCSVCGLHGENLDDGAHSVSCDKCKVWQHTKCLNLTVAQVESPDFNFICKDCKRKAEEANKPKLPPLRFRLSSSASPKTAGTSDPANISHTNGGPPFGTPQFPRQLAAVQIPSPRATGESPKPAQPFVNGPSLSPRGQALGPPGIHRSEAAYGGAQNGLNGASRPSPGQHGYSTYNGLANSSPPQWQAPRQPDVFAYNNQPRAIPQFSGSSYATPNSSFRSVGQDPFTNSFSQPRPPSANGGANVSPMKHAPPISPHQSNGRPVSMSFTQSPSSSFPPSSAPRPSFSPTKHSSPLPNSPMPANIPSSPAQILPDSAAGISPEKHDFTRPVSSHSISETPILPPIKALSPRASPQIMSPPTKKMTPERPHSNGFGGVY
ncbi:uncharacterized protein BDZ99DRAFT_419530 [Mytilinidion resinicola]|uniref:PHD-type domain-containing protein n=1 Tax=Mytilinidion resinicola TaxID=574789 RepID=A0A6A6YKL9_9PEZI|nr:uncharacterized protein BDZ99DRAFT_419530 [Mytilinidion resinicola]KAF2808427.1 hypothetical protein BDZ99DRAFT_419530 [Mytilinidion resinicola]